MTLKRRRIPSSRNWPHEAAQARDAMAGNVQWPNAGAVKGEFQRLRLPAASFWRTCDGFLPMRLPVRSATPGFCSPIVTGEAKTDLSYSLNQDKWLRLILTE